MDRRTFLRRSALIAAGVVAADSVELLEMLAPRRLFALGALPTRPPSGPKNMMEYKARPQLFWRKVQGQLVKSAYIPLPVVP